MRNTAPSGFPTPADISRPPRAAISRGEMADYLGLTIETISRQLTRLKAAGIIAFDTGGRECVILDRDWLDAIVNPS